MKIRAGFVSNSSSSSFAIPRKFLSIEQYDVLKNHIEAARSINWNNDGYPSFKDWDAWDVCVLSDEVVCSTTMDNFDLHKFAVDILHISDDVIEDRD